MGSGTKKMQVAVIGVGNVGSVLARKLRESGHQVIVAATSAERAQQAAAEMDCIPADSAADAARQAEALILAVPADEHADVAEELRPEVAGKPVVDVSNGPKAVQDGVSLAEGLQERLPGAPVVKAFNTAFASRMADPVENGRPLDGFIAGDDAGAKEKVATLVRDMGFEPLDVGELKMARTLEGMAWLNISLNMANGWPWRSGWRLER
jgi:predicted dinucleotide-binding enzyme